MILGSLRYVTNPSTSVAISAVCWLPCQPPSEVMQIPRWRVAARVIYTLSYVLGGSYLSETSLCVETLRDIRLVEHVFGPAISDGSAAPEALVDIARRCRRYIRLGNRVRSIFRGTLKLKIKVLDAQPNRRLHCIRPGGGKHPRRGIQGHYARYVFSGGPAVQLSYETR